MGSKLTNLFHGFSKVFSKPDFYIGVSKDQVHWAKSKLFLNEKKVFLLSNIVRKQSVDQKIKPKGVVLVSNIKPGKNQLFAIHLFKFLDEHLTIYGQVSDQIYFRELQKKVINERLQEKVTFITDCTNVQPELGQYQLALHTSKVRKWSLDCTRIFGPGITLFIF